MPCLFKRVFYPCDYGCGSIGGSEQDFPPKQSLMQSDPLTVINLFIYVCNNLLKKRILLRFLHLVQAVHGGDQLLQATHPSLGLLVRTGNQVQVLAAALEHDGEAATLHLLLRVLFQSL